MYDLIQSQAGEKTRRAEYLLLTVIILIFAILIGLSLYTEQPYVFQVNYQYKSSYYKPFVLPEGYDIETQGRKWAEWNVDEVGIQKMTELFNNSMGHFNTKPASKSATLGMKLLEEWIIAFLYELEQTDVVNPNFQGFPWGNNWYQFTISAPTTMAYYIVLKKASYAIKTKCASVIQYLIKDPQHSLGYERDKANSAMMLLPYTLAHMITNTLDTSLPEYKYAVEQYNIKPNPTLKASEDGVHIDYAYLTHNGVYAFGYLDSIMNIYPDTMQVIPEVKASNLDYYIDQINSILKHPTIPLSGATLYHRRPDIKMATYTGKTKRPEVFVVPSMRYMRYFTDEWQWCARACQKTIAYYESDQAVQNMGLYSILDRSMYRKGQTNSTPRFPCAGFITELGQTELPKVPHTNVTTEPHFGMFKGETKSYVFTDFENYAVVRSWWVKCPGLIDAWFDETIILDLKTQKAEIYYWIEDAQKDNWQICLDNKTNVPFTSSHMKLFIDFKENTYSGGPYSGYTPTLAKMTNMTFADRKIDNDGVTLISRNVGTTSNTEWVPFCVTPGENQVLSYEPYEVSGHTFKFDPAYNQFMYAPTMYDPGSDVSPVDEDLTDKEGIIESPIPL